MNTLFPIFLKIEHLHTLVVGGGYVGLEKVSALYSNAPAARVTLVAPVIREEIRALAREKPSLQLIEREFIPDDLLEKDLVLIATNNSGLNRAIKEKAAQAHLLANVADTPDLCDFYLSSVVQKGNLKLGISTNGLSPTLAKRLKEVLTDALPDNLETAMHQLHQIREFLRGDFSEKVEALNRITEGLVRKDPL